MIYNYKNIYRLIKLVPKVMSCRVNMTYFVQHHKILKNSFEEHDDPWKHKVYCNCEARNSVLHRTDNDILRLC